MSAVVELKGVTVRRGGRAVLRDVTFSVQAGQMVGVIGPNGAGKTTLLGTLLGLHRVSAGSLRVLGEDPARLGGGALARFRMKVGYVPQLEFVASGVPLTVREVVEISRAGRAGLLRGLSRQDRAAVDTWLSRMGLSELAERPYNQLSGGQQRKVQLARALAQGPQLLLLDEPASNLDLYWQETLIRLIDDIGAQTGITVLLVTHDLSLLPASCNRVVVLAEGALKAFGPSEQVLTPEVLAPLYGVAVQVERRDGRYYVFPLSGVRADA